MNRKTARRMLVNAGFLVGDTDWTLTVGLSTRHTSTMEVETALGDMVFEGDVFKHNYTVHVIVD